jgi:prefoldin alpha subunit
VNQLAEDVSQEGKYTLLQKLVGEYEYLGAVAQALEEQLRLIEAAELEVLTTISSVKELGDKALSRETLVSLGSGILAPMRLERYDKLLVLLGQNVYAKLSPTTVVEYLNNRVNFFRSRSTELVKEYSNTLQRIQLLQPKINRLAQELQQAG